MTANYLRAVNQSIPTWTWGITFFYFSAGITIDSQEEKCCLCKRVFEGSNMKKKRGGCMERVQRKRHKL